MCAAAHGARATGRGQGKASPPQVALRVTEPHSSTGAARPGSATPPRHVMGCAAGDIDGYVMFYHQPTQFASTPSQRHAAAPRHG